MFGVAAYRVANVAVGRAVIPVQQQHVELAGKGSTER